ncbi:MAG TPA: hypothetical protein VJZ27_00780, partial [Aggregatilineales bacterium]|nr:hypothetical protein [Aggregatilineales bacterium]
MNGLSDGMSNTGDTESSFNPSKLPDLPPDQLKLLRYIMRNSGITDARLRENIAALPRSSSFYLNQFESTLQALIDRGLVIASAGENQVRYRVSLRRKASRRTMQGIWDALDSKPGEEPPDSDVNPAIRRTRSSLADSLLADLSKPAPEHKAKSESATPSAQGTARTLMDDLFSAGRSAMAKRQLPDNAELRRE